MKNYILFLIFILPFSFVYGANSYHGDSVMSATGVYSTAPMVLSGQSTSSGNQYTSTNVVQYQTAICPAGLTYNGNSMYNSAQRTITTTYLGTQVVGTTTSGWTDTDSDCIGYQYQTIACPSGYTGSMTQQQKISTDTGGLVYGGWTTTINNCVAAPPPSVVVASAQETLYSAYGDPLGSGLSFQIKTTGVSNTYYFIVLDTSAVFTISKGSSAWYNSGAGNILISVNGGGYTTTLRQLGDSNAMTEFTIP